MLLTITSCNDVNTNQNESYGDIFVYDKGGEGVFISRYIGLNPHVIIPDYIEGLPVIGIDNGTFYSPYIEIISIETLRLPDTLIYMPSLNNLEKLTTVNIPISVDEIISFNNCISLEEIEIPNNIIKINSDCFNGAGIKIIKIPDSVTEIGPRAFKGCLSLEEVSVSPNITAIYGSTFSGCINLKEVIIPNSVYLIDNDAFRECISLKEITIPNYVEIIGERAFYKCGALEKVIILSKTINDIGKKAFSETHENLTIYCYSDSEIVIEYARANGINVEFLD